MVPKSGTIMKHGRVLDRIRQLHGNVEWRRVQRLLKSMGAEVYEGRGSTVTFVLNGRKLTVDRPHPRKDCGRALTKRVRRYLVAIGRL